MKIEISLIGIIDLINPENSKDSQVLAAVIDSPCLVKGDAIILSKKAYFVVSKRYDLDKNLLTIWVRIPNKKEKTASLEVSKFKDNK